MPAEQTRSRKWCFTIHKPTEETLSHIASLKPVQLIVGHEMGSEGKTPHLQGFVEFKSAKTMSAVKKYFNDNKMHLERPLGTDYENWVYCSKEGQVIAQVGEFPPEEKTKQTHADWDFVKDQVNRGKSLLSIIDEKPHMTRYISAIHRYVAEKEVTTQEAWREVKTTYIWGDAGIGKTRGVMDKYGHENVYRVTDKKNMWDGYRGEPVVVFEEFRSSARFEDMLNWLDGYPIMLPCRYANRPAQFERVYIITNIPLHEQYENQQGTASWGAFLRRIDDVIGFDGEEWVKWDSMRDYVDLVEPSWAEFLKGTTVTATNNLSDLI